ncbi:MAG TPA: hypothetical protein EYP25_09120 [Anaerolineae bacterium]|nr:hypothetical protein [Caldilineae bacterium]HID34706.1 hypothetical protein [Anaerolineae bacterium]
MTVFLQFLADNARIIYGAVALLALYFLYRALSLRRERRSAIFPLEKEVAMSRLYRLFGVAISLLTVLGVTWAASNVLLPELETISAVETATPDVLLLIDTPTPTPPPPTATPTATPTRKPRPTRKPPPKVEATPAPEIAPPACPTAGVVITSLGVGQTLTGPVQIIGTANIPNFQFYKLEWSSAAAPEDWHWFAGAETPVVNGVLGSFNPALVPPGSYNIRLVVVDNTGNFPPPCTVQVHVPGP